MMKEILIIFGLLLSIPVGYLIAHWTRDELVVGRKWFKLIIYISAITAVFGIIINQFEIFYTMLFILIVAYISYRKSFDKKFVRKRI